MADDAGTLPAQDTGAPPAEAAPAAAGEAAPGEKPKRGKPKDPHAPPKPKNAYQKCSGAAREKIKAERPEVAKDLAAMGIALKEEWEKVPQEEKDRLNAEYEKEMEVWKPKWAAYKQTDHYKAFFEIKQDWIDARQMKKFKKKAAKEAPTRPKAGYMIFASEVRARVSEEVKAAGGGLSDVGKKIADEWAAISEAKKGDYASQSAKQREVWLVEYAEYKQSDKYKKFVKEKAILENKQIQRKLIRTKLDGAPKKAPSSIALWWKETASQFADELKGKPMGEQAKLRGEKWAQVPAEEKAKFASRCEAMKKEYDQKKDDFKTKKTYLDFLLERRKAKDRENKTVGLINLPKRPQSVFAMFAERHKNNVPPGKGEGKGRSALKAKFIEAAEEEKAELAKKEAEAKQKFQGELAAFKESDEFKTYKGNEKKIQTEFMNEAMKVMTLKFLRHSPPAPPKTGFAVFVGEKRKADEEADGAPKGKKEKAEEVRTFKVEYQKLDKATKKEYDTSRVEKYKEWQAQVKEYMEKPMWQEYLAEAKRIKVPIKSLLADKGKVIKKLKNGMRYIPLPEKPVDMPVKPKQAYSLFVAAKKGSLELSDMPEAWGKLEEEERKKYIDEAADLQREYETNMKIFKESDEGKMYLKDYSLTVRRKRVVLAKFKFLGSMPKKPVDPQTKWMKAAKAEFPGLKGADLSAKLREKFQALPEEEREKIQKERQEQVEAFRQSVKEFKESENWQKYTKMVKAKAKSKGASSVPVPEDMPKKPRNALQTFRSEQAGKGLAEALKMFNELPQEEKDRRNQEAGEMQKKYIEDLEAWGKTDVGKKYNKQVASVEKRYKLSAAKERYLKNEPKKALTAVQLWANEVGKALIQQDDPSIKGFAMLPKVNQKWQELSSEDKQEWIDKAAAGQEEYAKSIAEWKATPDFKKYTSIVSRLNGVKPGAGKGKGAKPKAKGVVMPTKPDGMPKKPLMSGYFVYMEEKRASGTGISKNEMTKGWMDLGAEGQQSYNDKAKEQAVQYEKDMVEFNKTAEGKKYKRLKANADQKQKIENARKKFMLGDDVPKKPKSPQGAYFLFCNEKRPTLGGLGFKEVAEKVSAMWRELSADERKVYEDKNAEQKEQFEKEMVEYRNHPAVKAFEKASGTAKKKPKAKPKRKAAPKAKAAGRGKAAGGRGRGGGGRGRGGRGAAAAKAGSASDSDVMGSDSSSSSNDSDSD